MKCPETSAAFGFPEIALAMSDIAGRISQALLLLATDDHIRAIARINVGAWSRNVEGTVDRDFAHRTLVKYLTGRRLAEADRISG